MGQAPYKVALNNQPPVMKIKSIVMERLETIPVILPRERTPSSLCPLFLFIPTHLYRMSPRIRLYISPCRWVFSTQLGHHD